jgi:copper chaperone CopZ
VRVAELEPPAGSGRGGANPAREAAAADAQEGGAVAVARVARQSLTDRCNAFVRSADVNQVEHRAHTAGASSARRATVVLHVGGIYRGSEHAVVMRTLARRHGVLAVEANPVAQTATVTYDADVTSVAELRTWVEECGYHSDSNRGPLHYEGKTSEGRASTRGHARARSRWKRNGS